MIIIYLLFFVFYFSNADFDGQKDQKGHLRNQVDLLFSNPKFEAKEYLTRGKYYTPQGNMLVFCLLQFLM